MGGEARANAQNEKLGRLAKCPIYKFWAIWKREYFLNAIMPPEER